MITTKQQEKLINRFESLSELELDSVIEDLYAVLSKNRLTHLIDRHNGNTELEEEVEGLEYDLKKSEQEVDDLKDKLMEITNLCEDVEDTEDFEDGAFEELKKALVQIKSISE